MKTLKSVGLILILMVNLGSYAQELDANLQFRPRYEYRNGYKSPMVNGENAASFVSQRSRLNFNFKQEKIKLKLTLQNIRTWGDVTTTSTADKNGIAVFEAWGQYEFSPNWTARLGRQVISYDNQRIFGEIDWAQQAESHDAAVFSFHPKNHQLDLGVVLNANAENLLEPKTPYTTNYKSMQYVWYHTAFDKINTSFLVLNTGYEFEKTPNNLEVDYKQTFGTYLTFKNNKWDIDLGLYGQTGKSSDKKVSAWYAGANFGYIFTAAFKASLGYEFLSGKDQDDTDPVIKSFSPVFGTNHAFNGLMDYFYVGNHQNSVGLQDAYLKLNYFVKKWQFNLVPHVFNAPNRVLDASNKKMDSYLGTELDFTLGYTIQKDIVVSAGYSQMFASKTLERIKNSTDASNTNNWAWVMVSFNPRILTLKQ
ncbi:alginate export family protein [Flavobacterium pectinovorum]|uniref:alginate export family protein n=1 Tax=Flavobacterium pectinovorum TaxID=29533 RepID=UPI001FACE0CE|nr:alginate export family protein [Flavobacterium pectinovorum]MCI9843475.1 alginate export family protein [Flavobacterium pectinovorum]